MSVVAPPPHDEHELLIREARARQRRRRIRSAAGVAVGSALALALWSAVPGGGSVAARSGTSPRSAARPRGCPPGNLGTVAVVRGGALELLDLHGCHVRTLVRSHVRGAIAMSTDGRWVAFGGGYASTRSGRVERVKGVIAWAPHSDRLAVVTARGGLEIGRAGRPLRRLLPAGWGATGAAFSPDGRRLAVSRTAGHGEQLWVIHPGTDGRRELLREPAREGAPFLLQGFSPDGRWLLFWKDRYASLSADGLPLLALPLAGGTPRTVTSELHYGDYLAWCGGTLDFVLDRQGRWVTSGDGLAQATPPGWKTRTLLPTDGVTSWGAFSCGPGGALAVAAGPTNGDNPAGHEHRSIWLVRGGAARQLRATLPPAGTSDEWPSWSADGRWLLFVRTRWNGRGWAGRLFALDRAKGKLFGPIAQVGMTANYYGHYGWAPQLSWHRP